MVVYSFARREVEQEVSICNLYARVAVVGEIQVDPYPIAVGRCSPGRVMVGAGQAGRLSLHRKGEGSAADKASSMKPSTSSPIISGDVEQPVGGPLPALIS